MQTPLFVEISVDEHGTPKVSAWSDKPDFIKNRPLHTTTVVVDQALRIKRVPQDDSNVLLLPFIVEPS